MHVVHESISILNMSRIEISENRQAITDLVVSLHALDQKLETVVNDMRREIHKNKYFLELYLKLDLITSEIKGMLQNAMFYLEHLRTQLNVLSLGRLNPSTLFPFKLTGSAIRNQKSFTLCSLANRQPTHRVVVIL